MRTRYPLSFVSFTRGRPCGRGRLVDCHLPVKRHVSLSARFVVRRSRFRASCAHVAQSFSARSRTRRERIGAAVFNRAPCVLRVNIALLCHWYASRRRDLADSEGEGEREREAARRDVTQIRVGKYLSYFFFLRIISVVHSRTYSVVYALCPRAIANKPDLVSCARAFFLLLSSWKAGLLRIN